VNRRLRNIILFILILTSCNSYENKKIADRKYSNGKQLLLEDTASKAVALKPLLDSNTLDSLHLKDIVSPCGFVQISNAKDTIYVTNNNKIACYRNKFYFIDTKLAYCSIIDSQGNIISDVGAIGYDNGNYPTIDDFIIDSSGKRILLLSNDKKSVLAYSLAGAFIKEWKLPFFAFQLAQLNTNMFVFFVSQNNSPFSRNYDLMITDSNFNVTQGVFDDSYLARAVFTYSGSLQNTGKSHLFSMPFSDSIYQIDSDSIKLKYVVSFGEKDLPQNVKSNYDRLSKNGLKYDFLMKPILESKTYLCCLYLRSRRNTLLLYDKSSGKLIGSNLIVGNSLYRVFGSPIGLKNNSEFIFLVNPATAYGLITGNKNIADQIKQLDRRFYDAVFQFKKNSNPIIYFLKFKF
jgi:hypothetical protein